MVKNKLHTFIEKNCTMNYPFAYLNGDYCCKTNQELWYGGNASEVASGTCDGTGFSKESTCCNGHDYLKCPNPEGCEDFNGGKKLGCDIFILTFNHKDKNYLVIKINIF